MWASLPLRDLPSLWAPLADRSAWLIGLNDQEILGFQQRAEGVCRIARVLRSAHGLEPVKHSVPLPAVRLLGQAAGELGGFVDRPQCASGAHAYVELGLDRKIAHVPQGSFRLSAAKCLDVENRGRVRCSGMVNAANPLNIRSCSRTRHWMVRNKRRAARVVPGQ